MANARQQAKQFRRDLRSQRIEDCSTTKQKLELLVSYGILAPSTHNTQPWQVTLGDSTIEVFANFDMKIPEADPVGRDLYISLGAFIKNIELACEAFSIEFKVKLHLEADQIASITCSNLDNAVTPQDRLLLDALIDRQNYRGFFEGEIDHSAVERIVRDANNNTVTATASFDPKVKKEIADLTVKGLREAYSRPDFRQEIGSLINHNLSGRRIGLHGYSLRLPLPMSFIIPQVMKRKDIGAKLASLNYKSFMAAPGLVVVSAKDGETNWIEAGKVIETVMVKLAAQGIRASIYAASIEIEELRTELASLMGLKGEIKPQLLFCIGASPDLLPYSARKELAAAIKSS